MNQGRVIDSEIEARAKPHYARAKPYYARAKPYRVFNALARGEQLIFDRISVLSHLWLKERQMVKLEKSAIKPYSGEAPLQYDFFETEGRGLTNTIALWDVAPRGLITLSAELSDGEGRTIRRSFEYGGARYNLRLTPAFIERDGVEVARYPAEREQLVEEVVRQFAVKRSRLFQSDKGEAGVTFTLYEVFKELVRTGHQFSYAEIREALTILHLSTVEIMKVESDGQKAKERVVSGSTFPMLVWSDRNSDDAETVVSFNWLISKGVGDFAFRQMNYEILMAMPGPIERWLYRYLIHDTLFFEKASPWRTLKASEIIAGCGLVMRSRERDTYRRISQAMVALKAKGIIANVDVEAVRVRRKIVDVEYSIELSDTFMNSMKASANQHKQMREDFRVITGGEQADELSSPERRLKLRSLRRSRSRLVEVSG